MADHGSYVKPDLDRISEIADKLVTLGISQEAVEPVRDWVRDRRAGTPQRLAYFGCWRQVGHALWLPRMRRPARDDSVFGWNEAGPFKRLDGTLTPNETTRQSTAAIHHRDGWTALGIHDYTVDSRGNSNAVFVMDSDLSFERGLAYAEEAFPEVVKRISEAAPIVCVQTGGARDDAR